MRCTINDKSRLERILRNPEVLPHITDDGCDNIGMIGDALLNENCYIIMPNDNVAIMAYPMNLITYEIHIAIHPDGRGEIGRAAFNEGIKWIFDNTSCEKVMMLCPSNNLRLNKFVKKSWFKQEGRLTKSFKKNNINHDQLIMCRGK